MRVEKIGELMVEIEGDPGPNDLLLVHGAVTFEGCRPLLFQPELTNRCRVIHYFRRGYGGSALAPHGFSISDQAADAASVLRGLGIERAHLLGHSIGALIALQLAMDAPELVYSLVLVEPTWASRPEILDSFQAALNPVVDAYAAGDRCLAADRMVRFIDGQEYQTALDRSFGSGWLQRSASALDVYFQVELPAAVSWRLDPASASRLTQPAVVIRGEATLDEFAAVCEDVIRLLPDARAAVVPNATHNVIACNPAAAARLIGDFISRVSR